MALAASVKIRIGGQEVPDFIDLVIRQRMHGLHGFQVTCRLDTFEEPDDFVVSKSKKFIGLPIVIEVDALKPGGGGSIPGIFFKGVIHSVKAVKSDLSTEDKIVLSGSSPEYLLDDHPGCYSWENRNLGNIVSDVLKPVPRDILNASINPVYKEVIPYCVQYRESRLRFLQRLAARYGEWLYYNGRELIFGLSKSGTQEVILGKDLTTLDFSINLKATGFSYRNFNYLKAECQSATTSQSTGKSQQNEVGKYAYDQSAKCFSSQPVQHYPFVNAAPENYTRMLEGAMETEASALALGMSGVEATGENFKLAPGVRVQVKAIRKGSIGQVDYGEYLVDTIDHYCNNLLSYENHFTAVPVEAQVPAYSNPEACAVCETQSAVVTDNGDPEHLGRVRVLFHWQVNNQNSPWIRAVNPYSAGERGFYFIPEVGDEVMVGFEGNDAEKPYVIGGLFNGKSKPPGNFPGNNNSFKGIVTKSKLRIEFDDAKKVTTIDTPGGNKVIISDDQKSILLSDQNSNSVKLDTSGISMDSPKDINITSKGNVTIDATSGVAISAKANVRVEGMNIEQTAQASFTARGSATAELSASGNTIVKGALVMIN